MRTSTGSRSRSARTMSAATRGVAVAVSAIVQRAPMRVARVGEAQVVGPEVVAPLAQAVRLVDGEERDLAPCERGAEARVAEALRRHEHEPAGAVGERREHRLGLARRQRGVEHARRAVPGGRERVALVAHQRDERRDRRS